ncbi:hypothetical protein K8352_04040 [Flavobacteriaceae bacterium F89]|uniref:Uncharacterized protein n=1 Tax=Cerina litoralis TaxID=2874477 RepID=A0AAE3EUJ5_9FLAO|nr:hypothetical protein [Cerina litoralis]MCG2459906.1 hypothetical protein [Cerina litoralis]
MKILLIASLFLGIFYGSAQDQLNDYKYIIVPKRFDDFKKENQYKTSTLVKFLLEQKGFNAVYDDALPADLSQNRCLGLLANLRDASNMFTTKTTIVLKDCNNKEVFVSEKGSSKIKEYDAAYSEAIRRAFVSFDAVNYKYEPKDTTPIADLPLSSGGGTVVVTQTTVEKAAEKPDTPPVAPVQQQATPEVQSYKDMTPVPSDIKKSTSVLYAQEISNGYQLVDSTPKIVLKIYKSSLPNVYTAEGEGKNGMVYHRDGKWFFEYYVGDKLTVEELHIKF